MNVEYSSVLGYVFIIGGIAVGILAYAIYLNIRDAKSGKTNLISTQDSNVDGATPVDAEDDIQITDVMSEPPIEIAEDILIERLQFPTEAKSPRPKEMDLNGAPMPEKQELTPVATILREVDTGNLILRVGSKEYANVEELMDSTHWSRIDRLSSDLAKWLEPPKEISILSKPSSPDPKPLESKTKAPQSMVEEINDILERKLRIEDVNHKAIKIIEMLDGSVKVYIGVDSYPIDEVPFEDVRALIREAVSEWEESR
jgi:hypothetical protein